MSRPNLAPKETKILADIANVVYDWLPGSAPPFGKIYTFADAASSCGLGSSWIGGSKLPAIQRLLQAAYAKARLGMLVLTITTEGINYREKKGAPLTREEVESVNALLLLLRLKVPELNDSAFLAALATRKAEPSIDTVSRVRLEPLLKRYNLIETNPDVQSRGYELQSLLKDLFDVYGLEARGPFRVIGEEIDGSFVLEGEIYLLEARWRTAKANKSDLATFSDKVERKSAWTRGLFVSMSGFSDDAIEAMGKGKAIGFIIMSGDDLLKALKGEARLSDLLREKVRHLAERGELR